MTAVRTAGQSLCQAGADGKGEKIIPWGGRGSLRRTLQGSLSVVITVGLKVREASTLLSILCVHQALRSHWKLYPTIPFHKGLSRGSEELTTFAPVFAEPGSFRV